MDRAVHKKRAVKGSWPLRKFYEQRGVFTLQMWRSKLFVAKIKIFQKLCGVRERTRRGDSANKGEGVNFVQMALW